MSLLEKLTVKQFEGKNFQLWKFMVERILRQKKCEDAIKKEKDVDEDSEAKAQMVLALAIADSHMSLIRTKKTAFQMWRALCDKYEKKDAAARATLRLKLNTTTLKDGEDAEKFIMEFNSIVDQIREIQPEFSDMDAALHIHISTCRKNIRSRFC